MNKEKLKIENTIDLAEAIEENTNISLLKQNKKHKKYVMGISLVIILLIAILLIALYILNNPRLIFNASINNIASNINNNINNVKEVNINISGMTSDNYNIDLNENKINEENIKMIVDSLKKAFLDSTAGEKIKGQEMTIKVNNNDIKTTRTAVVINNEINNKFISNLKNNQEFLKAYSNISNLSKSQIKNKLNDLQNNFIKPLTINIYTSGLTRNFVKLEIFREINNMTNVINLIKLSENEYEYKIVNNHENLTGNIIFQDNDIIINFYTYQNDNILNNGTFTIQKKY